MKYKGIRMQLLGITLILFGMCFLMIDKTITNAYLCLALAVIGAMLSIVGFFVEN